MTAMDSVHANSTWLARDVTRAESGTLDLKRRGSLVAQVDFFVAYCSRICLYNSLRSGQGGVEVFEAGIVGSPSLHVTST
jgi:hypothetical protein